MKERYIDCDVCDERFVGEDMIHIYLQECDMTGRMVCRSCHALTEGGSRIKSNPKTFKVKTEE